MLKKRLTYLNSTEDFNLKKKQEVTKKKNKTSIQLFSSYHCIDELRRSQL
jgi:hypothetical protein